MNAERRAGRLEISGVWEAVLTGPSTCCGRLESRKRGHAERNSEKAGGDRRGGRILIKWGPQPAEIATLRGMGWLQSQPKWEISVERSRGATHWVRLDHGCNCRFSLNRAI